MEHPPTHNYSHRQLTRQNQTEHLPTHNYSYRQRQLTRHRITQNTQPHITIQTDSLPDRESDEHPPTRNYSYRQRQLTGHRMRSIICSGHTDALRLDPSTKLLKCSNSLSQHSAKQRAPRWRHCQNLSPSAESKAQVQAQQVSDTPVKLSLCKSYYSLSQPYTHTHTHTHTHTQRDGKKEGRWQIYRVSTKQQTRQYIDSDTAVIIHSFYSIPIEWNIYYLLSQTYTWMHTHKEEQRGRERHTEWAPNNELDNKSTQILLLLYFSFHSYRYQWACNTFSFGIPFKRFMAKTSKYQ